MATSPRAIPVRIRVRTFRQMCQDVDPDFTRDANLVDEYEWSNGRVHKGYYKTRGAYADDEHQIRREPSDRLKLEESTEDVRDDEEDSRCA